MPEHRLAFDYLSPKHFLTLTQISGANSMRLVREASRVIWI
jgi:hypothetical protein